MTQFDESQHPRGDGGKFSSHVGGEQEGSLTDGGSLDELGRQLREIADTDLGFDPTDFTSRDVEHARRELERIGELDPEAAHSKAEDVVRKSLDAIRDGHADPARIADAALTIDSAKFTRWYA